ncbi:MULTISPECIES: sigma-70 family RNA polymerase sigma factor [Rodentibacter]|uniref:sigma-70 family RNA polymerase sigma factor n=1 Tax=Rodentibacter TaxID=1960084 RepID=UPI001CFEFD0B|nr:sigma-70 family RNA polymerase sigma factor [Rodentibacter sp. JRC1]GJI55067.1 putative RNA polymerase sigma factor [Rodentibacter sp. JRC1]
MEIEQLISSKEMLDIRTQMLSFAQLQLRDPLLAEDLVQEAFVSALKNINVFRGQSALKTWIFAILKNKILDYLRIKERFVLESDLIDEKNNSFFDEQGHWKSEYEPKDLQQNENEVYCDEFWRIFEICLNHLPARQARVFMMREYLELSTDEICKEAAISVSNLHTSLYRARLQLQYCLSNKLEGE